MRRRAFILIAGSTLIAGSALADSTWYVVGSDYHCETSVAYWDTKGPDGSFLYKDMWSPAADFESRSKEFYAGKISIEDEGDHVIVHWERLQCGPTWDHTDIPDGQCVYFPAADDFFRTEKGCKTFAALELQAKQDEEQHEKEQEQREQQELQKYR